MAKLILEIQPKNKEATQSVKLLNAEVQTLSKTLSSIKVNKNLTTQINALSKYYTNLAKAAVRVNEATTKRQIAEQKLANEVKRGRTEDQRTLKVKAEREQQELRLKQRQDQATQSTQKQTAATKQGTKANEEHRQSILSMTRGIFEWQIATTLVMKPLRMLRSMSQSINDTLVKTEDAVIALQRVLPSGSASDSEISSRLYKIAQDYGQTFENVQQIAQNFARTGMSWADTIKATEAAVLALNVAELNAEEATTGLIAILSQFGLEASDLESVIDKLNKTADNFPVTTEKILAALQRTGSAASNANLTLEETISLITALSKATGRSGENIGTALNSLIQYSRKDSALNTFAGLSDESAAVVDRFRKGAATILDVWQQVSKEIQSLDSRQADLLDNYFATEDGNALKDALDGELEDIYTEMAGVYDTANTFRKNYFIALLGNMDTVLQAQENLQSAEGYSQRENQKYLDTYTAKVNKLNAQWEELANSEQGLLGIKKFFVELGSALLTVIKWTGGLRTTLIATGTALTALFTPQILSGLVKIGSFFKNLSNPIKNFQKATQAATKATQAQTIATNLQSAADARAFEAQQLKNSGSATAAAIERAETLAIQQQTIATQAQANADKLAAEAAKAKAVAMQTAIGIIGIGITVVSTIVGLIQSGIEKDRQAAEEAQRRREETISAWEAIKNEAIAFAELNKQYNDLKNTSNKTTKQEKEFLSVQEQIIKTLGYKAIALKKLTEGSEKYNQKLEELTNAEIDRYAKQAQAAANAGKENYINSVRGTFIDNKLAGAIANSIGLDYDENNPVDGLDNLLTYLYDNGLKEDPLYDGIYSYYEKMREAYETFLTAEAQAEAYDYRLTKGIPQTQSEIDSLVDSIVQATGASERWRDTIEGVVGELTGFKTPQEETDKWANDISKVASKYDDLISKLEELRDLNKEAYDWEEKKLAVLEAEQALENARNEATVRRFNEATWQWEWQTDEKKIKEAEENLEKARLELERGAFDNIIKQLEEKTATNEGIEKILQEVAPLIGEDFANTVRSAIKELTGVDISIPPMGEDGSYDSGGIANGLGYMPKATSEPETVNNPELTAKILSPVSNAQFDKYVRDMGIMFEMARHYSHAPVIERIGGATDNRVDNSGQITMNGVTIGSDRRGNSLDELLTLANIIPNT